MTQDVPLNDMEDLENHPIVKLIERDSPGWYDRLRGKKCVVCNKQAWTASIDKATKEWTFGCTHTCLNKLKRK